MLQSLRQPSSSSSSQQVPTAVDVTRTTLDFLNILLGWRAEQQSAGAQDWCSERWRPVVDLLLGWAPRLFGQCLDHFTLTAPEAVQPSHAGSEAKGCPVEEAMTIVLRSCLRLLEKLLKAGAGAWTRPNSVLNALSAWLQVAVAWARWCAFNKEHFTWAGRPVVLDFLLLLVAALCGDDRGLRKTLWPGRVAQLLAKDRKLSVAVVRQAVLPALEGKVNLEEGFWALQILGCFELQPALVQAVIEDAELLSGVQSIGCNASRVFLEAWFTALRSYQDGDERGDGYKLTTLRQGVETVQVYWQFTVLLLRLQQELVSQGLDEQATELQVVCYPAWSTAHVGLATTLEALLAACEADESYSSAQADWQPTSQPEHQLLWQLAVACRGALDNLIFVSTVERYKQTPAGYYEPSYAPKQRASGRVPDLLSVLEAAGFCLSAGLHPLWHSLWAALYATAQQEPGLQVEHGLLDLESNAAEQAAEERALLALQFHLQRLAEKPVSSEKLHQVLLNLVAIQKDVVLRLAHSGQSNLMMRRSSLDIHLSILRALLPAICQPAAGPGEPTREGSKGMSQPLQADCRQLHGAAFLATFSLGALCDCFVVLDRVTIGWDTSAHERILAEAVQRARDALSVVQQAAAGGATHFLAYSTLMCLVDGIFKRLVGCLKQHPGWGATLLSHAEVLLEHLAGCMSTPAIAISVVMGGFCPVLASFLVKLLRTVKADTAEQPALLGAVQRLQKLGCQLVKACCQAVDKQAGTALRAVEWNIEDGCNATLRQLLQGGGYNARTAAVEAALGAWVVRLKDSLPSLTVVARAAQVNSLRRASLAPGAATGCLTNGGRLASSVAAVQRELAISAVLACARPWCSGRATAFSRGTRLRLCAGCRGVRYCSEECAKQDWARHHPCCKALQLTSQG